MTTTRIAWLRFTDPAINSDKYWHASIRSDCTVAVAWGRLGTKGSSKTHQFTSMREAQNKFEKLVQEKTRKGYVVYNYDSTVEVGASTPTPTLQPDITVTKVRSKTSLPKTEEPELIDSRLRHINWGRSRNQI